jgi:hypothetical protein
LLYEISSKISSISDGCPTGTCNKNHTMYWTKPNWNFLIYFRIYATIKEKPRRKFYHFFSTLRLTIHQSTTANIQHLNPMLFTIAQHI